ncbi:unnamed protein product, partial [Menidia menidia]
VNPSQDPQSTLLKEFWEATFGCSFQSSLHVRSGERVYFDENGDPAAAYELVNWQPNLQGDIMFVPVGSYDASQPNERQFKMNGIKITWAAKSMERPQSVCSESCLPGFRQAMIKGKPICCFSCIACAAGEISNSSPFGTEDDTSVCEMLGSPEFPLLSKKGHVTIGGAFSIHSQISKPSLSLNDTPEPLICSR